MSGFKVEKIDLIQDTDTGTATNLRVEASS